MRTDIPRIPPELLIFNRGNVRALAARLRALRVEGKIRFTKLVVDCGIAGKKPNAAQFAQQRLSRWLTACESGKENGWKTLDSESYRKIVEYLSANESKFARDPDQTRIEALFPGAVYHSIAQWLDMSQRSLEDVRTNFPGVFTIYRHSLLAPGHVLVGSLEIACADGKTVTTTERYHIDNPEITPARDFELTGYLFRRNGKYRILSKESGTDELQYMYINAVDQRGGLEKSRQIIRMSGILSDLQGHTYYSTRFCCVRGEPKKLTAIPLSATSKSILTEIGKKPELVGEGHIASF
jgi:hypothetical protein